jgi:hypothetical protein
MTALTLSVKSVVVNNGVDSNSAIATAFNDGVTYTTIYGFAVFPISNTQSRIFVLYA